MHDILGIIIFLRCNIGIGISSRNPVSRALKTHQSVLSQHMITTVDNFNIIVFFELKSSVFK